VTSPLVSVVIPVLNEDEMISDCLRAVADQDYPLDAIEVLVVDGGSSDDTVAVARAFLLSHAFARGAVLSNHPGTRPSNLNRGLAEAQGDYLCRVDARSRIPPDYVRICVEVLRSRPNVRAVGGTQIAVPPGRGVTSLGIARALNNRFAMGLSRYRRGAASGPSDTVYLGAYVRSDLEAVGGWRPLEANEDFDLNRRLARKGLIWFDDRLRVRYVPRASLPALYNQYRQFGSWKVRYWRRSGERPLLRQWVVIVMPAVGPLALAIALSRASSRQRAATTLAIAGAAVAVEALGATEPSSGPAGHAAALPAMAAVAGGWLRGLIGELLRRTTEHSAAGHPSD
jgi:succinoglycan biosynthesis protein ExoA